MSNIRNRVATRVIEQLAIGGQSTLSHVASQIGEDPVVVSGVSNFLIANGIIKHQGSRVYSLSKESNAQIQEFMSDDNLSLVKSAQIVIESTDSNLEDVDIQEDVHDTVPVETESNPVDTVNPIKGPDGTSLTTEDSVQDAIQNDSSTSDTPDVNDPAPDGDGTSPQSETGGVEEQDTVHDAVPASVSRRRN